jgi:hypothetical protein
MYEGRIARIYARGLKAVEVEVVQLDEDRLWALTQEAALRAAVDVWNGAYSLVHQADENDVFDISASIDFHNSREG